MSSLRLAMLMAAMCAQKPIGQTEKDPYFDFGPLLEGEMSKEAKRRVLACKRNKYVPSSKRPKSKLSRKQRKERRK